MVTHLPEWTSAFTAIAPGRATMTTPDGTVEVALDVLASRHEGTVDWKMTFPDGSVAMAWSRVMSSGPDRSLYSFVLTAPPVPLEAVEGALEQQSEQLREELARLKAILSGRTPPSRKRTSAGRS